MAEIPYIPRRHEARGRSGTVGQLPGPLDIAPRQMRPDRGLDVSPNAFGAGAFGAVAATAEAISDNVLTALDRQKKREDAIALSEASVAFDRDNATALQKFQTESDPSNFEDYRAFEASRAEAAKRLRAKYEKKLGPDALASLDIKVNEISSAAVRSAQKLHLEGQQARAASALDNQFALLAEKAAQHPDFLDVFINEGVSALDSFAGVLTPEQEQKHLDALKSRLVGESVRGWVRAQKDPLDAITRMDAGNLPEGIKLHWNTLDPKDKEGLRRQSLTAISERISLENRLADREEKRQKEAMDTLWASFYRTDDPKERERLYRGLIAIEDNPERVRTAKAYWQSAGTLGTDDAPTVLIAEQAIRDGRITSASELFGEFLGRGVSADTARTRLVPLIESMQDKNFKAASEWVSTKLGIPPNTILGSGESVAARRVSEAQAQLLEFRQANPKGDYWAEARKIADRILEKGDPEAAARLPILEQQFKEAVRKGDTDRAARLKAVIETQKALAGKK